MNTLPDLFGHVHKIMEKRYHSRSLLDSVHRDRGTIVRDYSPCSYFSSRNITSSTLQHNNYSHANLCLTRLVCVAPFKSCPLLIFAHTFSSRYFDRKPKSNFLLGFWHYRSNYCSASFARLATPNIDNETLHSEW